MAHLVNLVTGDNKYITGSEDEYAGTLCLQCTAITGSTCKVQGSLDNGTTKFDLLLTPAGSTTTVTSFTGVGAWRADISGIPLVYLDCAGGTSATIYWTTVRG